MQMLDAILKFSKKHAEAVIVVLLGVISAGSISGGIWIAALKDALQSRGVISTEREELYRQRMAVLEATAADRATRSAFRYGGVNQSFVVFVGAAERFADSADKHVAADLQVIGKLDKPELETLIRAEGEAFARSSAELRYAIVRAADDLKRYSAAQSDSRQELRVIRRRPLALRQSYLGMSRWALLAAGFVAMALMTVLIVGAVRAKRKAVVA